MTSLMSSSLTSAKDRQKLLRFKGDDKSLHSQVMQIGESAVSDGACAKCDKVHGTLEGFHGSSVRSDTVSGLSS
jgi:hypothetical protein